MQNNHYGTFMNNNEDESRFIDRDYSIGGGVSMVRSDFEHGFPSFQKKNNGEDEKLRENILESLHQNELIDSSEIDVSVKDGMVYLNGWVHSREEKLEVLRDVFHRKGVLDVLGQIYIRNIKT